MSQGKVRKMKEYAFKSNSGDEVTVRAGSEGEARSLAMIELHGTAPQFIGRPSFMIGKPGWTGRGLYLIEKSAETAKQ